MKLIIYNKILSLPWHFTNVTYFLIGSFRQILKMNMIIVCHLPSGPPCQIFTRNVCVSCDLYKPSFVLWYIQYQLVHVHVENLYLGEGATDHLELDYYIDCKQYYPLPRLLYIYSLCVLHVIRTMPGCIIICLTSLSVSSNWGGHSCMRFSTSGMFLWRKSENVRWSRFSNLTSIQCHAHGSNPVQISSTLHVVLTLDHIP